MKAPRVLVDGPLPTAADWTCVIVAAAALGELSEVRPRLRSAMDVLVRGGKAGLLGGEQYAPWQSDVAIARADGATAAEIASLHNHVIDAGAVRVLANLLVNAANDFAADFVLRVSDIAPRHRAETTIKAQEVSFPATYKPTPFALTMAMPEKSAEPITVRLEFAEQVSEATAEVVWARLRTWEEVVRNGGYAETLADARAEPGLTATEGYLLSPTRAEFVAYGFWGADAALEGLVNVISRVAVDVQKIATVEIW